MIGLTLVADPFNVWRSREVKVAPFRPGTTVSDYLPDECHDPEAHPVLAVCHNARVLPPELWAESELRDGDHISVMIRPGVETVVLLVVTAIVSAWQVYDSTRRAKVQAHHAARRAAAAAKQMGDSPTYGWGGQQNVVNPGGPIQVLFGGPHRVAGQYIKAWPIHGNLDMVLGISEGEVEGLIAGTVEINGKPQGNYSAATIAFQIGSNSQAGLGIFAGPNLMWSGGIGATAGPLSAASGPANGGWWWGNGTNWLGTNFGRLFDTSNTQTKETVLAIDGYEIHLNTGRTVPTNTAMVLPAKTCTVVFQFDVRERTLPAGSFGATRTFRTPPFVLQGGFWSGPANFTLKVSGLPISRYEVEVRLNVAASTVISPTTPVPVIDGGTRPLGILWTAYNLGEFLDFDRINPGLATLGVEGLPAAVTGGVLPTITSVWEGRKIRNILTAGPPATFTAEEFRSSTIPNYGVGQNPALIILDILTNQRYGAGEYIDDDLDLDIQSFIDARDFCDTLVTRGLDAINPLQHGLDKTFFNPSTDIDDPNDEIDISNHRFVAGDKITYSDEGGTTVVGLTDGGTFFVGVVTANAITLHLTRQQALGGTSILPIAAGANESHSLLDANNGVISASNQFSLPAGATIDFTDGSIKIDDTLVLKSGLNIDRYRIENIVGPTTLRISGEAPPFPAVVLSAETEVEWDIENTERRCLTALYFDGVTTVWQAIESVAQPARLAVVRSNGKIALIPDDGAPGGPTQTVPVQVFGMGNITKYKSERLGAIVANRVEVQFLDEQKNWEQAITSFEDPVVASSTKLKKLVRTQVEAFGVTRRSQATRIAKYHWVSNSVEKELIEFEADAVALPLQWGDVIQVIHDSHDTLDLPTGRIKDVQGLTVIFDQFYIWDSGSDRFGVQRSDGGGADALVFLGVVTSGAKIDRFTFASFPTYTPVPGDVFSTDVAFVDSDQQNLYRVTDITRTEDHKRKVSAVSYVASMFVRDELLLDNQVDVIALAEHEG